jgi:hypothetical protein
MFSIIETLTTDRAQPLPTDALVVGVVPPGRRPYIDPNLSALDVAAILALLASQSGQRLPLLSIKADTAATGHVTAQLGFLRNPKFGGGVLLQLSKADERWRVCAYNNWFAQ